MNELNLIAYNTAKGLYFASNSFNYSKLRNRLDAALVNGKPLTRSEHKDDWYFLEGEQEITSIQKYTHGGYDTPYWKLKDSSVAVDGVIPERIELADACEVDEDDFYIGESSKYYPYRALYERCRDSLPNKLIDVVFNVEYKGTIEHTLVENNYKDAKVRLIDKLNYVDKVFENKLSSVVTFSELEQLLTPDIALHNRPCYIDSDTTYKIIRAWIREHIDGKYARITSDYDFCFTVEKIVKVKPWTRKTELKKANGKSYASPKFKETLVENKEVEIFEMCPSKKYGNYTPIVGFKGDSLADLVENMQLYLTELMEVINAPLKECEHCGGVGVHYDVVDGNERG